MHRRLQLWTPVVEPRPGSWANNLAVACGNNCKSYRPFVGIGSIERKDQTGSSNYNAFEASVRHQIGGLELNVAYTFSHSIDDSSDYNDLGFVNSYNLNAYRASSDFDQRHNITIAYVYDLPVFQGDWTDPYFAGRVAMVRHHADSKWLSV